MEITKAYLDAYRSQLSTLGDAASEFVQSYIDTVMLQNPGMSVAECRELAKEAINEALYIFGDQAAALACDLYDEVGANEGFKEAAQMVDGIDRDQMDRKVRWLAGKLREGDKAGFTGSVTDLTRFYVKRQAYENIVQNCIRNDVRFARVPSGIETCAFCFMLSGRGFVYSSELTAEGGLHGMHNNCDCIVVPGVKGVTRIDGYNPEEMYKRWKMCEDAIGGEKAIRAAWDSLDDKKRASYKGKNIGEKYLRFKKDKIMREVETRDWEWLYTGTCAATRRANRPKVRAIKELNPKIYEEWQESVSKLKKLKTDQCQRKHIIGTPHYEREKETPSHFTIGDFMWDFGAHGETENRRHVAHEEVLIRELINKYAGSGVPSISDKIKPWNKHEFVQCDTEVAFDARTERATSIIAIVYGTKTVHAYPVKERFA